MPTLGPFLLLFQDHSQSEKSQVEPPGHRLLFTQDANIKGCDSASQATPLDPWFCFGFQLPANVCSWKQQKMVLLVSLTLTYKTQTELSDLDLSFGVVEP